MARQNRNAEWRDANNDGSTTWDHAKVAVLMDIREELQRLNQLLHCSNFIAIPRYLREIRRNTTKRKRKVAK